MLRAQMCARVAADTAARRATALLTREVRARHDFRDRHSVLARERRTLDAVLRSYDADGDGVLSQTEAADCFCAFFADAAPEAVAAAHRDASGGYTVTEVQRVVRCGLLQMSSGYAKSPGASAVSAVAENLCSDVYAQQSADVAITNTQGRWVAVRRSRQTIDALVRCFSSRQDGSLTPLQAVCYLRTLLEAEAAVRGASADFRSPRLWAQRLECVRGLHPLSELRRVTRMILFTMPSSVTTEMTIGCRLEAAEQFATDVFRQLQAEGSVMGRHRVLRAHASTIDNVFGVYDSDGDGALTTDEALDLLTMLLTAEAAARDHIPAESGRTGGRRLLSKAHADGGLYRKEELARVVRAEMMMTSSGIPTAELPMSLASSGVAAFDAATSLFRRLNARTTLMGRMEVLGSESTVNRLLKFADSNQDGVLTMEEASGVVSLMLAARETAEHGRAAEMPDATHRRDALHMLTLTPHTREVPVGEVRRLLMCELLTGAGAWRAPAGEEAEGTDGTLIVGFEPAAQARHA